MTAEVIEFRPRPKRPRSGPPWGLNSCGHSHCQLEALLHFMSESKAVCCFDPSLYVDGSPRDPTPVA
jgi:hypothetical protein